jgi:hypothetical protein
MDVPFIAALVALGFTIQVNEPNHIVATKDLPELSEYSQCPPPWLWFERAWVEVEISNGVVHPHFWERREYQKHFFQRPCESTGLLEKQLAP